MYAPPNHSLFRLYHTLRLLQTLILHAATAAIHDAQRQFMTEGQFMPRAIHALAQFIRVVRVDDPYCVVKNVILRSAATKDLTVKRQVWGEILRLRRSHDMTYLTAPTVSSCSDSRNS